MARATLTDPPMDNLKSSRATELSVDDKQKMLDIITTLRSYQLLGIIEARDWIEILFPEFGEIRNRESDEMFKNMATAGRDDSSQE